MGMSSVNSSMLPGLKPCQLLYNSNRVVSKRREEIENNLQSLSQMMKEEEDPDIYETEPKTIMRYDNSIDNASNNLLETDRTSIILQSGILLHRNSA